MTNEYILRHMLLKKIDFRNELASSLYLSSGWGGYEKNFRWTVSSEARMQVAIELVESKNILLRVLCEPYLANGHLNRQEVDVIVNGKFIIRWVVNGRAWQEVSFESQTLMNGELQLAFIVSNPTAPAEYNLSVDTRRLGISFSELEILDDGGEPPDLTNADIEWVGQGVDLIGDVFKVNGYFYRAIKKTATSMVRRFIDQGIYENLANRHLIPSHRFFEIQHDKYSMVTRTRSGTFVYPTSLALQTLKDAALVWLDINEFLLNLNINYGLVDGHYGNFALFDNSKPMWIDIGSISDQAAGHGDISFGLNQFIGCYVYPLVLLAQSGVNTQYIREIMQNQPHGITRKQFLEISIGDSRGYDLVQNDILGSRRDILLTARRLVVEVKFDFISGYWSSYRNVDALEAALSGKLLEDSEDTRFRAVVELVRRSKASIFLDIGANDGLFSLLCVAAGLKGMAVDLDDHSLNKLYNFISNRPNVALTVVHRAFLDEQNISDLVLALAITHHLYISQGLCFEKISDVLANCSSRVLITEFMPDGLGGTQDNPNPYPNPLPSNYTIENFLKELRKKFLQVDLIDYFRPNPSSIRQLIYCEGKVGQPSACDTWTSAAVVSV
jgi:hypothetical protein